MVVRKKKVAVKKKEPKQKPSNIISWQQDIYEKIVETHPHFLVLSGTATSLLCAVPISSLYFKHVFTANVFNTPVVYKKCKGFILVLFTGDNFNKEEYDLDVLRGINIVITPKMFDRTAEMIEQYLKEGRDE